MDELHGHDQFEKTEVKLQELSCFLLSAAGVCAAAGFAGAGAGVGVAGVLHGMDRLPNNEDKLHELSALACVAGLALALAGCEELHGIAQFPKIELRPHEELELELETGLLAVTLFSHPGVL